MIDLEHRDGVSLLTMTAGENRFNLGFVGALADAVQAAAKEQRPLVLTGTGKVFSLGLDLAWLSTAGDAGRRDLLGLIYRMLAELMTFPGATVAAVNGHAFGAGAILAAAADRRLMRADRGWFCFPEVDLGLVMSDQFDAVVQAKYPRHVLLPALLSGQRYGGEQAREAGLVDGTTNEADLLPAALEHARALAGKNPAAVAGLKRQLYRDQLAALLTPTVP